MLACRSRGTFVDPASVRGCVPMRDPESGCFMLNAAESEDGRGDAKTPMPCGICLELIRFTALMSVFFRIFVLPHGSFRESILSTRNARKSGRLKCNSSFPQDGKEQLQSIYYNIKRPRMQTEMAKKYGFIRLKNGLGFHAPDGAG